MDLGLQHCVALVAGGSVGIGAEVCRRLAAEGASVAVLARSADRVADVVAEISASGGRALATPADVRDVAALDGAIAQTTAAFGPPTIVVWAVAERFPHARLPQVSDDELSALIDGDLVAAMRLARRVIPGMMSAKYGRFVLLSSVAATMGIPGGPAYAAAKAGLEGLARAITLDHGRHGVTANAVRLGFVDTERLRFRRPEPGDRAELTARTATHRLTRPEDVAAFVAFLCSAYAAGIAGAALDMDEGVHLACRG